MDSHVNPTLLLGVIGGILLLGATTVINGTIWATSIDMATPIRPIDSVGNGTTPKFDDRKPGEGNALSLAETTARVDCMQPALGPDAELLDAVCVHDL